MRYLIIHKDSGRYMFLLGKSMGWSNNISASSFSLKEARSRLRSHLGGYYKLKLKNYQIKVIE